jgi:hypothetical protein
MHPNCKKGKDEQLITQLKKLITPNKHSKSHTFWHGSFTLSSFLNPDFWLAKLALKVLFEKRLAHLAEVPVFSQAENIEDSSS